MFLRQDQVSDTMDIPYVLSDTITDTSTVIPPWLSQDVVESTSGTDWTLSNCCDEYEKLLIALVPSYLFLILLLWNTFLMKPMKLIAVFVHEMSHATACWLTCGKVEGIEVHLNEGGVTKYRGGWRWLIIPAGYCGGAFWGGFLVTMSGNRIAALVSSVVFCVAMLVSLRFSPNRTMVFLNLFFITLTVAFIVVDTMLDIVLTNYLTLFYGVFIGAFSVYDIYDDLITRTVEGSDAHACFKLIPCCLPRCVGLQFAVVALMFQALGLYFALVWMTST
ncbi:hypothetical protein HJC23_000745 [Cyclotella cryptica]|uniref:Peptidase M50B-like-domain-containing protein n=1 Tax=Cyclotella cryptica TaxID=29204 RepID=A0ABD3PZ37_9STRA